LPGELFNLEYVCWSPMATSDKRQIYEGTNQIQRVVMARQLLK
jgi:alkylation response protein AidB-like acyl-CoA dehydrogenase